METGNRGIRILSTFLMIFGFMVAILRAVQIGLSIGMHKVLCMPVQGCTDTEIGFFYALLSVMLPGLLFAGGLGLRQGKLGLVVAGHL
ncbi:hypothetical protein JQC72_16010 [Polycladomyces sp. WAk]|uniref:Uncharacterized protein n=1 Tax=Polycladomyces zharkentensis TaxID=2807616 RepID=A0ABS2WN41_9BACL|nr:hypothetical protein [Polycladomyces sp. WAk]MBN2910997.1 hypothetical protein [Polycladomyces sp. WAk]